MQNKVLIRILQVIIVSIPFIIFFILAYVDINPSGIKVIHHSVNEKSPFIDRLLPEERALGIFGEGNDAYISVIDEPVYFSVYTPQRNYDSVQLDVEFDNEEHRILEVGALVNIFSQSFNLKPLHNLLLERLDWNRVIQDEVTLFQRQNSYESVDQFLSDLPDRSQIATYHYDLDIPYRLNNYSPRSSNQVIDASLRGFHKFVTYIGGEDVYFRTMLMDMNRTTGKDDVVITVWNENGDPIFEKRLDDDGNSIENQLDSTREIEFTIPNLPEGVYTFDLSGTSDIFWRQIETNLRYVTFVNSIYLGDDVGYLANSRSTTMYTNAKNFTFETLHAEGVQDLTLGSDSVEVNEIGKKIYYSSSEQGVLSLTSPQGDIKIVGDGKFAFSQDAFFEPDPVKLNTLTDIDALNIDYILTTYQPAGMEGDWSLQSATFDLDEVLVDEGKMRFLLSAPFIADLGHDIDIHAIHLIFKKESMTWRQFLREVIAYLPFGI